MSSLQSAKKLLFADAKQAWGDLGMDLVRGRRVLLTGASGLIGCHFLAGLLQLRRELAGDLHIEAVVHTEIPEWFNQELADRSFRIHRGDLAHAAFVDSLPTADIVIHAATYGQPMLFSRDPISTLRLNTSATLSLLDKVQPGGKFLFLSSSEVYSGLKAPPYREEQIGVTNTTHARACYIEAKRCGEVACFSYSRDGVQARAARLCLAFGPGTRCGDTRVLNAIIERGLRCGKIHLLDDGSSRRTYCYVSDALFMLWRILLCGKQAVYNVGGIWGTSVLELAQVVGRELKVPVEAPGPESSGLAGAPKEVSVDCSRFEREFGRLRFVPAEIGIARTISWQKYLYSMQ
jgi:UDP-glucuronate decarboxylase